MVVTLGIVFILGIIIYQDIRFRKIYWIVFPLLGTLWLSSNVVDYGLIPTLISTVLNLLFVLLQFSILILLVRIRFNRIRGKIDEMIGWGDILFIICLCFGFPFYDFLFILISGLMFSLLIWNLYSLIKKPHPKEIPLCGIMALFICIILISDLIGIKMFSNSISHLPAL